MYCAHNYSMKVIKLLTNNSLFGELNPTTPAIEKLNDLLWMKKKILLEDILRDEPYVDEKTK